MKKPQIGDVFYSYDDASTTFRHTPSEMLIIRRVVTKVGRKYFTLGADPDERKLYEKIELEFLTITREGSGTTQYFLEDHTALCKEFGCGNEKLFSFLHEAAAYRTEMSNRKKLRDFFSAYGGVGFQFSELSQGAISQIVAIVDSEANEFKKNGDS